MKSALLSQKIQKTGFLVVGLFFVLVSTIGMYACTAVLAHTDMAMKSHAQMSMDECMTMASETCTMNVNDHTEGWQLVVNSLLAPDISTVLFALVLSVVFFIIAFRNQLFYTEIESRFTLYKKAHPNIRLYYYLPQLFSRGILQPTLYA